MTSNSSAMAHGVEVLGELSDKVSPQWTALLLVDLVNDFLDPDGKTAATAGRPLDSALAAIAKMSELAEHARRAGVTVVHVAHVTLANGASHSGPWLDARSRATYSADTICLEGTWGAQILDDFSPLDNELVVRKYRYSGFAGTNLDSILRSRGIRTVVCTGVSTNVCVEATAREAFSHDYYVVIPSDACASWDDELHDATLRTAAHRYATVTDVESLGAAWSQATVESGQPVAPTTEARTN